jgi:two-component system, LytTR family, response regulator
MKALIIDDEHSARETLKVLLRNYCPTVEIIAEAESGMMGIKAINHYNPELVFLDVELKDMSSFEMLDTLGFPNLPFDVIFSTAHDHYAVTAFRYSAVDFLPKPVQERTLQMAVMRAQENLRLKQKLAYQVLNEHLRLQTQSRMIIRTSSDILIVPIEKVIRMHSVKGKSAMDILLMDNKRYTIPKSVGEYEHLAPFIRIHNSSIINPNHITRIYRQATNWKLEMSDGGVVEVAASRKSILIDWLEKNE